MSGMKLMFFTLKKTLFIPLQIRVNCIASESSPLQPILMTFNKYEVSPGIKKPPVVLMHGLFGSKSNWNTMAKLLGQKAHRDVICVDARNHGESPHTSDFSYNHLCTDINFLFENLKIYSANVIGHSMGGRAMMLFALTYPEKIEKIVIVDISPFDTGSSIHGLKYYIDVLKSVSLDNKLSLSQARKSADQQLNEAGIDDPDVRQFLLTNLIKKDNNTYGWRMNLDALSVKFEDIVKFPTIDSVCNKPALFIAGTRSDYLRPEHEKGINKLFPSSRFVYLDCGHWVHAEKPMEFLEITSDFINNNGI